MHAVCVLHVVLNPASRVSAVDRSSKHAMLTMMATELHLSFCVILVSLDMDNEASSCALVSSQDKQNVIRLP